MKFDVNFTSSSFADGGGGGGGGGGGLCESCAVKLVSILGFILKVSSERQAYLWLSTTAKTIITAVPLLQTELFSA